MFGKTGIRVLFSSYFVKNSHYICLFDIKVFRNTPCLNYSQIGIGGTPLIVLQYIYHVIQNSRKNSSNSQRSHHLCYNSLCTCKLYFNWQKPWGWSPYKDALKAKWCSPLRSHRSAQNERPVNRGHNHPNFWYLIIEVVVNQTCLLCHNN